MAKFLINSVEKLDGYIDILCTFDRLSCDTETKNKSREGYTALYPFHGGRSFSIIFATSTDEYYFNFNVGGINPKHKKRLQKIFDSPTRIIFFVNAIYDATILHFDGIDIKSRIVDCPSIARIDYNKHGRNPWDEESFLSLSYLAKYYKVQQKNDAVKEYIQKHDLYLKDVEGNYIKCLFTGKPIPLYHLVPIGLMFEYGCDDARSTFDIGTNVIKCINFKDRYYSNDKTMLDVAKNEIKLTSVLVDLKIRGFRHWTEYTKRAVKHEEEISLRLGGELENLTNGMNLNSGPQLAEFLVRHGVEVPRKAPTETALLRCNSWLERAEIAKKAGKMKHYEQAVEKARNYSLGNHITDKKTLAKLLVQHPKLDFLSKITTFKEAEKKLNTYYKNFLKLEDENGIIHCGLNQEKAKTGRFSSSEPNLQNLEKVYTTLDSDEFAVRKSFIADEGCRLFFVDYKSQEMIVMLDQAGEMNVINKLLSGEHKDFYLATASILKDITGIEITRQQAKAMALGLAYGQGAELLARNLGFILPNADKEEIEKGKAEAQKFKDQFFKALPKLLQLKRRLENDVKRKGRIENAFGRVLYFNPEESYKALNGFIQSTSADITKKAMVDIHDYFKNNAAGKSRLTLTVHDELIFNIEIGKENDVIPLIKRAMISAYHHINIPLDIDIEYAPSNKHGVSCWAEKIKWEGEIKC